VARQRSALLGGELLRGRLGNEQHEDDDTYDQVDNADEP
jgi:hypothetical protein